MRLPRFRSLFAAAAVCATIAACSKDSSTAPTGGTTGTTSNGLNIALDTGMVDGQTVPVGTVIPVRVRITLKGAAAPSTSVIWRVTAGHGTVPDSVGVTDATGLVSVKWTVGDTSGVNSIAAVITGASVTLTAQTTATTVSSVIKVSPDSSAVVAGGTLPLVARAVDRFGNPVSGTTIKWSTTGGTISADSVTTGTSGNATTNLTTPSTAGTFLVTASLPGKASVTFKVVGF